MRMVKCFYSLMVVIILASSSWSMAYDFQEPPSHNTKLQEPPVPTTEEPPVPISELQEPSVPSTESPPPQEPRWCTASVGASSVALQDAVDYVCGKMGMDCSPINPGGACYFPPILNYHASFVMNRYYQSRGRNLWNCDFNGIGSIAITDPSYGSCIYDHM
ncbi:hypothetical protein HHK36_019544 [Tetracentron sinense]|uniref:X8 domain-containing protein n=1 Tax=Tetracentron sinense TaxID=13715 RepID=A0A834YU14_TETSI|nr:hypothetical protein HHK36_019544 [Tetracentron sinense]